MLCFKPPLLQLREDHKKGIHVENLKEIEVSSARDVIQQLMEVLHFPFSFLNCTLCSYVFLISLPAFVQYSTELLKFDFSQNSILSSVYVEVFSKFTKYILFTFRKLQP